jgi:NDP-sugar pyrophosphorylase family protein
VDVSGTQAVILAGGLGTRLRPITETVPKPMISVKGKPFLEYEVHLLEKNGVRDLVLCLGYLGEVIENYFGDGSKFGVRMRYSYDGPRLLGPAGALKRSEPLLEDSFFVTYGDAYLRAPYRRIMKFLLTSKKLGLMAVYRNDNWNGKSDVAVSGGHIVRYDKNARAGSMHWINFGVSALRRKALDMIPPGRECFEPEFYGKLIEARELQAFPVTKRFYEIGNLAALTEFERLVSRQTR